MGHPASRGRRNAGEGARATAASLLLEHDGELRFAGIGGIVEGFGGAIALCCVEVETVFDAIGKSGDAGFAVGVGADFEIELAHVHESVGDVDADFGVVDGRVVGIGDGEVGGAWAKAAIDDRDGLSIRSGRGVGL